MGHLAIFCGFCSSISPSSKASTAQKTHSARKYDAAAFLHASIFLKKHDEAIFLILCWKKTNGCRSLSGLGLGWLTKKWRRERGEQIKVTSRSNQSGKQWSHLNGMKKSFRFVPTVRRRGGGDIIFLKLCRDVSRKSCLLLSPPPFSRWLLFASFFSRPPRAIWGHGVGRGGEGEIF